jgi:hypothetical protein
MNLSKKQWIFGIIVFASVFIASAVIFNIFEIDILPSQFFGALIGVVITAIITVLLLQGQTSNEEQKEKNMKIFEKKQEVYHNFLAELKKIIQDNKISIHSINEEEDYNSVDELKDLIFQLGLLKLHTKEENVKKVFESVGKIIQMFDSDDYKPKKENKDDKNSELDKMTKYYNDLNTHLFSIINVLKKDLYDISEEKDEKVESSEKSTIKYEAISKIFESSVDSYVKEVESNEFLSSFVEQVFKVLKQNNVENFEIERKGNILFFNNVEIDFRAPHFFDSANPESRRMLSIHKAKNDKDHNKTRDLLNEKFMISKTEYISERYISRVSPNLLLYNYVKREKEEDFNGEKIVQVFVNIIINTNEVIDEIRKLP